MSRRNSGGDPEFGSDSFLDIIANIVGILIILIVVAGVKVARQPAESVVAEPATPVSVSPEPVEKVEDGPAIVSGVTPDDLQQLQQQAQETGQSRRLQQQHLDSLRREQQDQQQRTEKLEASLVSLQQQMQTEQQRQDKADSELAAVRTQHNQLAVQLTALEQELRATEGTVAQQRAELAMAEQQQQQVEDALKETHIRTARLQETLIEEAKLRDASQPQLKHRLSPVARTAGENELHFRMSEGRIAWIPLTELLDQLKQQVVRRAGVVRRFGRYEGHCGPTGGFVMNYTVEKIAPSPLRSLHDRTPGIQIGVSRWTITPADTLRGESMDAIGDASSRFRQIVESAELDTTVTIWLYPDDFRHFSRVRELVHRLGMRVAARPLPDGEVISGSPGGSRSSGQ